MHAHKHTRIYVCMALEDAAGARKASATSTQAGLSSCPLGVARWSLIYADVRNSYMIYTSCIEGICWRVPTAAQALQKHDVSDTSAKQVGKLGDRCVQNTRHGVTFELHLIYCYFKRKKAIEVCCMCVAFDTIIHCRCLVYNVYFFSKLFLNFYFFKNRCDRPGRDAHAGKGNVSVRNELFNSVTGKDV